MLQKLVTILIGAFNSVIKPWLVSIILGALGLAGGFWTWLVALSVGFFAKKAEVEISSQARIGDQTIIDKELNAKYQKQIKEGASETDLIKSELDILNGGRH